MRDPYSVLGVKRSASAGEIKRAYRRLARASHPDLHPGDEGAAQRFQELQDAYAVLGDSALRSRYDAGELELAIDEIEARPLGLEGVLGRLFSSASRRRLRVRVSPELAHAGGRLRLELEPGRSAWVTIPAGQRHGSLLELDPATALELVVSEAA